MTLPPNLSEEEVLLAIDEVVDRLAPTFTFGYYDIDDLKQEGRIYAMEALPRYKSNRGTSLRTFLHNHVRNRYLNLKRDKYARPAPKNVSSDELECWLKRNSGKRSLIDTLDISDDRNEPPDSDADSFVGAMQQKEMLRIIDMELPMQFRGDYRRLLEDVKLPKARRLLVLEALRSILNEYLSREREETRQTE